MKNIVIISSMGLYYDNSAGVARMNSYVSALSECENVKCYLLSEKYLNGKSALVKIGNNAFTTDNLNTNNKTGLISSLRFMRYVKNITSSFDGETIYLYYPNTKLITEIVFLTYFKVFRRTCCFREANEVRKFDSNLEQLHGLKKAVFRLNYSLVDRLSKYYDGLVCISKNISEYFSRYNKNSILIPALTDIQVCEKVHVDSDIHVFVFTGSVSIEKENLEELFKAFALFDNVYTNWKLLLYGGVSGSQRKRCQKIISQLGIENKVEIKGTIPHSMIPLILSKADCLLLSRNNSLQNYYGFSTKLSEYALSGTPILMTDTGVVSEYFKDEENCLMTDGYTAENFFIKLCRFENMTIEERKKIGENARNTAMNNFYWKNYSEVLNHFLSK